MAHRTIHQDYHIHTNFSCDCEVSMIEMCRAALERGIPQIGFTEHFDLFPHDPCYTFFQADTWWEELSQCRDAFKGSLTIRAGIELGEPHVFPREIQDFLDSFPWDYALGSLHWVDGRSVFDDAYFEHMGDDAYVRYFRELAELAEEGNFDILAHLDVVKRQGVEFLGAYDAHRYETEIRNVLRICADRDLAIEINTSTLWRSIGKTSPSPEILGWFLEEGGRWVTFGSDSHRPEHVGYGIVDAFVSSQKLGLDHQTYFRLRKPNTSPG